MAIENKKQVFLIAFAVIAGIAATALTSNYVTTSIEQKTQELHDQYERQQKQVVSQIQQRSEQQVGALKEEIARVRQEQQQAMQQAAEAMRTQQIAAQQAAQQALRTAKSRRSGTMLTNKTPPGKRAVTVMIDSLNAVGGLLNAGDFVDVIAHLNMPDDEKKKTVTAMLFQDLEVLAINTNLDDPGAYDDQQNATTLKVTFAVDPQEAGLLAFANKNGRLELALRGPNENDKQIVKASTWKTLADYVLENQGSELDVPDSEPDVSSEPSEKPYIQIFRGGKEL